MTPPLSGTESAFARDAPRRVRFAANGVALVLELPERSLPQTIFWGQDAVAELDLGDLHLASGRPHASNGLDSPRGIAILPEAWTGWTGTAGVNGHRQGESWSPQFIPETVSITETEGLGGSLLMTAVDDVAELAMTLDVEMMPSGLVRLRAAVQNLAPEPYVVDGLHLALPVPGYADDLLDLAGRWAKERVPQRSRFQVGSHLREGRHGRTGADAAFILTAGEAGFGFDQGEVWGMHVAFSGNHRSIAERAFTGERLLLGGELLLPGEVVLAQDESYSSPNVYATYGRGLDDSAARIHQHLRSRENHPRSARPVVMNVWEAVYFDHNPVKLAALAEAASAVGVERFVLDDGWFGSRRDDRAGLGDWHVSPDVWGGDTFAALVRHVNSLGMEFGLWFEPEMVNVDSDLARRHPEWIMQVPGRLPVEFRNQQVLDISHPDAFAYIRDSIVRIVREYGIRFIKWDHNRDLIDAGSTRTKRAAVHDQTLATYRLLSEIRAACPELEIESCSSGGARIDLGILEYTDRVWASDCIDAHERQQIQRWTAQLLPPELVGSHVGAERAHTTGRRLDLSFRAATAVFGHFGIEWDLTEASPEDLAALASWVDFYKAHRELIHTGRMVRASGEDDTLWLHGAVSPDRDRALYSVSLLDRPVTWPAGRVRLPGLDEESLYRIFPTGPDASGAFDPKVHPEWWGAGGVTLPGRVLTRIGIEVPALSVDHSALIGAQRVARGASDYATSEEGRVRP